ncbi:SIR2 family protein [Salinicola sp. MH3R3-1]|uniref:SIR2 family NAD-dependent protein deacylase n=1 Tax=Salinicola sp. MH3R3-1 TaxID=1928762 RepID=UPI00094E55AF|nr:SIR2 family protein [Salinicola sp. MH3R3-1]OLO07768.1 SIR2 family protein [Salinicola sp. MH3R3-1]
MSDVSSLPDYAALKKLASALWQEDGTYHGAAVMVGAGFGRSAASTGDRTKKMPLWNNFSTILSKELDSNSSDPLRLAEEYCAYFGKQALHDLIKKKINDSAWQPGDLYNKLLELPWSEVLTTNWDTLLERASARIHQPIYSIVSRQEDLSSARSPRIVKLHGTIDVSSDLVFTEEDYRKYPVAHAAFVNFSRQVFIENELCLIGFSGDDPNFLQWAGWVRDNLAIHSRRIYLVGALELSSAKRKYLESINVAPIDFSNLVASYDEPDARHLKAIQIFFECLKNLEPKKVWEWCPEELHDRAARGRKKQKSDEDGDDSFRITEADVLALEKERLSYPDWLVCPRLQRSQVKNQIFKIAINKRSFSHLSEGVKSRLLYEIAWRHSVVYEIIPQWLVNELFAVCDPDLACGLTKKQQLELAAILLANTRWLDSSKSDFDFADVRAILMKGEQYWSHSNNELFYHDAILARDGFDYQALENLSEKLTAITPIWKLRKASLFAELGRFDEGESLVAEAYKELLFSYRNEYSSIYIVSRLAWAHWIMRGIDISSFKSDLKPFPSIYQDSKCDPWDHIEEIRERVSKDLDRQQQMQLVEPSFEPGRYKNKTNGTRVDNETHPLVLLDKISSAVGMPLKWSGANFFAEQAARLAELDEVENFQRFSLAIRSANSDSSDVLKKVFSRMKVACIPEYDVQLLIEQCSRAIDFFSGEKAKKSNGSNVFNVDRLRVFIEVLARLSVRASIDQAKSIFCLSVSLAKKNAFHHVWLFDPIDNLAKFSLKSVPENEQHEILLDALSFPLQSEISIDEGDRWANPVVNFPGKRVKNSALDRRVDEIIDCISYCSPLSAPALLRLIPLVEKDFLTNAERNKIAERLWGECPLGVFPDVGLLKYVFLKLPAPECSDVENIVRHHLFEDDGGMLTREEFLADLVNAAKGEGARQYPTSYQAVKYFEKLVAWRRREEKNDIFGILRHRQDQVVKLIGEALSRSVVPSLALSELSDESFEKLNAFYFDLNEPEVLGAFPFFAASNQAFVEPVEKLIKKGLQSNDANTLAHASYAILVWRDLQCSPTIDALISRFVYTILPIRMIGLSAMLFAANEMYAKQYLSSENVNLLIETLPIIFDSAEYSKFDSASRESISVSFVRSACVKLAKNIIEKEQSQDSELLRILQNAEQDPLPEVRFLQNV